MIRPTTALLACALLVSCRSGAPGPAPAVMPIGSLPTAPQDAPVTVEGRVTARFDALGGWFLQDAGDGDPATSDAVFVHASAGQPLPEPGTHVRVTG